ncbi:MAG: DnaB-like helicase N-terminal domain-containing protein, partial [Candidatus Heimdallarchaeaceae archaeon]
MIEQTSIFNLDVEESIIGSLLFETELIPQIVSVITSAMFYDSKNKKIYSVISELIENGTNIDATVVLNKLKTVDESEDIDKKFLNKCINKRIKPGDEKLKDYLKIIVDHYVNRFLLESFESLQEDIIKGTDKSNIIVKADKALTHVIKESGDIGIISSNENYFDSRMETLTKRAKTKTVLTGYRNLDDLLSEGFAKKYVSVIFGRPGSGKAQPLYSKVLTVKGWKKMGDLKITDKVIGADGLPKNIISLHPQGIKDIYKITMSHNSYVYSTLDHLWLTKTRQERKKQYPGQVRTTEEIMKTLKVNTKPRLNHSIDLISPIHFPKKDLKIHPYILGVLLGNGRMSGNTIGFGSHIQDKDIISRVSKLLPYQNKLKVRKRRYNYFYVNICGKVKKGERRKRASIDSILQSLGLKGKHSWNKFIPEEFLLSSIEDRLELLRGLIDTDGSISTKKIKRGNRGSGCCISYSSASKELIEGVVFLVRSLGGLVSYSKPRKTKYYYNNTIKQERESYKISFKLPLGITPVYCNRKKDLFLKYRNNNLKPLYIKSIEFVHKSFAQCI